MKVSVNISSNYGGDVDCYRVVAVFNRFGWQMSQYELDIKTLR